MRAQRQYREKLLSEESCSNSDHVKYLQVSSHSDFVQQEEILDAPCIKWSSIIVPDTDIRNFITGKGSFGSVVRVKLQSKVALGKTIDDEEIVIKLFSKSIEPSTKTDADSYECNLNIALLEIRSQLYAESKIVNKGSITKVYGIVCGDLTTHQSDWLHVSNSNRVVGIVMRYERGGTLKNLIYPANGCSMNLSMSEKLRILMQIAQGLSELHLIGVVHGDIKPDNILFSDSNLSEVRLADFGLSAIQETSNNLQESTLMETVHFKGTPVYAAPELLTNVYEKNIQSCSRLAKPSRKSDMYAFAILMWEFITEKKPFDDIKNSVMLCSRVHQGYRPSLDDIPKEYPNKLKDMMSSTWDKDRRERKSAIECFRLLKFYHELMLDITYDVYLLNHTNNQNIANFIWHRLIQKGLNVKQCNEITGLEVDNNNTHLHPPTTLRQFQARVVLLIVEDLFRKHV